MRKIYSLFIVLIMVSCTKEDEIINTLEFNKDAYDTNQAKWEEASISNYSFTREGFSTSTGPYPAVRVIVKSDTIHQVMSLDDMDIVGYSNHTITELYAYINTVKLTCESSINDADSPMESALISVAYDEQYHYPKHIEMSGGYEQGYLGGLAVTIDISDFQIE